MARGTLAAGAPAVVDHRLEDARRAFGDAGVVLDETREHLLRTHVETARLWHGTP